MISQFFQKFLQYFQNNHYYTKHLRNSLITYNSKLILKKKVLLSKKFREKIPKIFL